MESTDNDAAQPVSHLSKVHLEALASTLGRQKEDEAIQRLLDSPEFADDPDSPNLLTLMTQHGEDASVPEWRQLEDDNATRTSGPLATRAATVRWAESEGESEAASVESRLSTFSMHLAKCAPASNSKQPCLCGCSQQDV